MDEPRPKPSPPSMEPAGIPGPADRQDGDISSALPEEAALVPDRPHDDGTLVPDQLHDAPEYIPPPMGMLPGAIVPPVDPADVPSSAWITTAPPARRRSPLSVVVTIGAVLIGLAVVALVVAQSLNLFAPRGKVVFGKSVGNACEIRQQTDAFAATEVIYLAAFLKSTAGPTETLTLRITQNGQEFVSETLEPYGSKFDCFAYRQPIGPLPPGVYLFDVLRNDLVEATGTLTVT